MGKMNTIWRWTEERTFTLNLKVKDVLKGRTGSFAGDWAPGFHKLLRVLTHKLETFLFEPVIHFDRMKTNLRFDLIWFASEMYFRKQTSRWYFIRFIYTKLPIVHDK